MKAANELSNIVGEIAYAIYRYLGNGYLEKIYENALTRRLQKAGLEVKQQHPLKVHDEDGGVIGEYCIDLFVENRLIVELKACHA